MASTGLPPDRPVSYSRQYRRCGKPGCLVCGPGMPGHGPYWYAYWREGGRTRSRYLGRTAPPGVQHGEAQAEAGPARRESRALRVRALGGFAVWLGDEPLPAGWGSPVVAALFKCLLGAPGHRLHRDQLLDLLWPDADPGRGAGNLRAAVHRLRRALGDGEGAASFLRHEGEMLVLSHGGDAQGRATWLDADTFEAAARTALAGGEVATCRAALALYTGEYLPDDPYAGWAVRRREELRGLRVALLLHAARLCDRAGEAEEAEGHLRGVLEAERCHEEAALALMRLYAGAGRPAQAVRVFRRLVAALREELELEPEARTRALYRELVAQQRAGAPGDQPAEPAVPSNLPEPLTSFIGRRRELTALCTLLRPGAGGMTAAGDAAVPCRLLTLTGVGGCGKTRLALAVADELLEDYPDGVWLVELATLGEGGLVAPALARALGQREEAGRPVQEGLTAALRSRRVLLLLDNCEHLVGACAELAVELLEHCPALRILATSREALGVGGERVWPVPPLTLPDAAAALPVGRLLKAESVRLFMDRVRAQRPELALTDGNAAAVAAICRRLEGLPLAIELAAARIRILSLGQLAARLEQRLALLTGGPRTAAARQRALRATLDWSHDLLSREEQALFRRLSLFAGGCAPSGVAAVCRVEGDGGDDPLEGLAALVNKSLLVQREPDAHQGACALSADEPRFGMLETVREYGLERLGASGELAVLRRRHAAHFLALAEEAEPQLKGAAQAAWLARLEEEHDNLRSALRWALEAGEQELGLRLAGSLWQFWSMRGYTTEGRDWLESLLAGGGCSEAGASAARAMALNAAGALAYTQGDLQRTTAHFEECLSIRRALGDRRGMGVSLNNLGNVAYARGDQARALTFYEESVAIKRKLGERWGMAMTLSNMGAVACDVGDYARALALHEESLAIRRHLADRSGIAASLANLGALAYARGDYDRALAFYEEGLAIERELGSRPGIALKLHNLGELAYARGEYARAQELQEESLAIRTQLGDRIGLALTLNNLGELAYVQGDLGRAAALLEESVALHRELGGTRGIALALSNLAQVRCAQGEIGLAAALFAESLRLAHAGDDRPTVACCLEGLAAVALEQGRTGRAGQLCAAATALREVFGARRLPADRAMYEATVAAVSTALGGAVFAAAWAEGHALSQEQAVALALEGHHQAPAGV